MNEFLATISIKASADDSQSPDLMTEIKTLVEHATSPNNSPRHAEHEIASIGTVDE